MKGQAMEDLTGKKAIVTGGTRGLGAAIVQALAQAGATVTYTGRNPRSLDLARARMAGVGAGVLCDMRDRAALDRLIDTGCDILINNASLATPLGMLDTVDGDDIDEAIAVNLTGPIHAARRAAKQMAAKGQGTIINISSGAAYRPVSGSATYCVTKAGLFMLTRALHEEFGGRGVSAFGLRPGVVDTDMQGQLRDSGLYEGILVPRDKLAQPEAPAAAALWLCQHRPEAMAGTDVNVIDPEVRSLMALDG